MFACQFSVLKWALAVVPDIVLRSFSVLQDEFKDSSKSAMTTCFLKQFILAN
jgi:hypothetical protein